MNNESCDDDSDHGDGEIDLLSCGNKAEQARKFLQLEKTLIMLIRKGKLPDPHAISLGVDKGSKDCAASGAIKELTKYGYETKTEKDDKVRNARLDELLLIAATMLLPNAVRYFLDKGADVSYRKHLPLNRMLMTFGNVNTTSNTGNSNTIAGSSDFDQLRKQMEVIGALLYDADGEVYGDDLEPQQEYVFNLLINQFIHYTARAVITEIVPNIEQKISGHTRNSTQAFSQEYHLASAEDKAVSRTPQTDQATMDIHLHHLEVSRLFFDLQPSCRRGCPNPALIPNTIDTNSTSNTTSADTSSTSSVNSSNTNTNTVIINDGTISTITVNGTSSSSSTASEDKGASSVGNADSITGVVSISDMVPGWEIARRIVKNPALSVLGYATPKDDDKEKDKYRFTIMALEKLVWDQEDRILRIVPDNKRPGYSEVDKVLSILLWHNDRYFLKPLSCWNIAALLKTHHLVFKLLDYIANINNISNASNTGDDYLEGLEDFVYELKNHFRTSRNLFLVFPPLTNNENGALSVILTLFNLGFAQDFTKQLGYADNFCAILASFCRQLGTLLRPQLPPVLSSMTIAYL